MDKSRSDNHGFTLIEVLIAISLLSVGLMALASLAGTLIRGTEVGKRQTQAINLANEKLELLKGIPIGNIQQTDTDAGIGHVSRECNGAAPTFACIPNGATGTVSSHTVKIDNVIFEWKWTVTYIDLNGNGQTLIGGLADSEDIKKIDLTVTWRDIMGTHNSVLTVLRKV